MDDPPEVAEAQIADLRAQLAERDAMLAKAGEENQTLRNKLEGRLRPDWQKDRERKYTETEIDFIQSLMDRYSECGGWIDLSLDHFGFMKIVWRYIQKEASTLAAIRENGHDRDENDTGDVRDATRSIHSVVAR